MQARTETVAGDRLRELANRPDHTVYEYTYEEPEAVMMPEEQIAVFRAIVAGFDGVCQVYPGACDEELRERVLGNNERVRLFQRIYPKVFAFSTVRVLDPEMEERLDKTRKGNMAMLIERAMGEGDEDMKAAKAMQMSMRLAMRSTKPEDLEGSVSLDAAAQEAGVATDAMRPLNRFELGPSTVRQSNKAS